MTSQDVSRIVMAGNDIALQWYALTHDRELPTGSISITPTGSGGVSATFAPGTMLLMAAVVVAAVLIFKK
jgi:hypothetical protein